MKKIISLIAIIAILFSISVTAFAAATVGINDITVDVAEGTTDVTMNVSFSVDEPTVVSAMAFTLVLPEGVTLKSYDSTQFEAFCDKIFDDSSDNTITLMDDDMECTVSGSFAVPVVLAVDTTNATEYSITINEDSYLADADGEPINDVSNQPVATITVKEAKKPVENTIEPETDVIIDNTQYMGTAVYAQEFDLKAIDTTKAYGIKVGNETVVSTISGDGIVNYVLAYFGVADVDAIGTVQSFWTAK